MNGFSDPSRITVYLVKKNSAGYECHGKSGKGKAGSEDARFSTNPTYKNVVLLYR